MENEEKNLQTGDVTQDISNQTDSTVSEQQTASQPEAASASEVGDSIPPPQPFPDSEPVSPVNQGQADPSVTDPQPTPGDTDRANAARRRNAQKSTGPRTPEGKRRVARNACQHGLYAAPLARTLLTLEDNPDGFREELQLMIDDQKPVGRAEHRAIEGLVLIDLERERVDRASSLRQAARPRRTRASIPATPYSSPH
jgi:hypothetical protein